MEGEFTVNKLVKTFFFCRRQPFRFAGGFFSINEYGCLSFHISVACLSVCSQKSLLILLFKLISFPTFFYPDFHFHPHFFYPQFFFSTFVMIFFLPLFFLFLILTPLYFYSQLFFWFSKTIREYTRKSSGREIGGPNGTIGFPILFSKKYRVGSYRVFIFC